MRSNIFTTAIKKAPAFFLAATLIFATEAFVYANRPALVRDYWNKFLIDEPALLENPGSYSQVLLGNSTQKTGVRAAEIGPDFLALGLAGAKPMAHYLLFERYLKKHPAPKTMYLFIDGEDQADSLLVILRYFADLPEFLSVWRDLSWKERSVFLSKYFATLDFRKVSLRRRTEYSGSDQEFRQKMTENQGFMPAPDYPVDITDDYYELTGHRTDAKIVFDGRDDKYLGKLLTLARAKGTRVVLVPMLVPQGLMPHLMESGFAAKYGELLDGVKKRFPETTMPRELFVVMPNSYFEDPDHLNEQGSVMLTEYFRSKVLTR